MCVCETVDHTLYMYNFQVIVLPRKARATPTNVTRRAVGYMFSVTSYAMLFYGVGLVSVFLSLHVVGKGVFEGNYIYF